MNKKTKTKKAKIKTVEVVRSFTWSISLGQYMGTANIFASYKAECAPKDVEKVNKEVYQFCKKNVIDDVNELFAEYPQLKNNQMVLPKAKEPEVKTAENKLTDTQLPLQGRSPAEKKDFKNEVREGAMMDLGEPDDLFEHGNN